MGWKEVGGCHSWIFIKPQDAGESSFQDGGAADMKFIYVLRRNLEHAFFACVMDDLNLETIFSHVKKPWIELEDSFHLCQGALVLNVEAVHAHVKSLDLNLETFFTRVKKP